jgi:uncharacterized protein VcgC/VcgE DUF2780
MTIKTPILVSSSLVLALALTSSVQAGWLDFLNDSGEQAAETVQQGTDSVKKATQINQAVQTGTTATQALPASQQGLTGLLMQQLGVSQAQAEGGAGALFQVAKDRMAEDAFGQLSQSVPGMDGLLAAAPKTEAPSGALGNLSSMLGNNNALGSAAQLMSAFKQLNLSEGMVSQFTPIVMDYVKQQGGPEIANLLQLALGSL